jgi:hypothetical protein
VYVHHPHTESYTPKEHKGFAEAFRLIYISPPFSNPNIKSKNLLAGRRVFGVQGNLSAYPSKQIVLKVKISACLVEKASSSTRKGVSRETTLIHRETVHHTSSGVVFSGKGKYKSG